LLSRFRIRSGNWSRERPSPLPVASWAQQPRTRHRGPRSSPRFAPVRCGRRSPNLDCRTDPALSPRARPRSSSSTTSVRRPVVGASASSRARAAILHAHRRAESRCPRNAGRCSRRQRCSSPNESGSRVGRRPECPGPQGRHSDPLLPQCREAVAVRPSAGRWRWSWRWFLASRGEPRRRSRVECSPRGGAGEGSVIPPTGARWSSYGGDRGRRAHSWFVGWLVGPVRGGLRTFGGAGIVDVCW